jgi:D-alanyl-lipoteichoic acid acyltransferase DltB (MBOAT superfamily)
MVFNSLEYAVFLPVVLAIYWLLKHRQQNALLLFASYLFYGAWDVRFLGLMMFSTVTDYFVGKWLAHDAPETRRRRIFFISLAVNLGILATFKYFNFFIDSAGRMLEFAGFEANLPTLRVLLPVGISFYTFHGISYTADVYRRHIEPAKDLLSFAVFISFFPQLVAGPIGRAHIQLPQFEHPRTRPNGDQVRSALVLLLVGLFKKVAIADALAPFVNRTFAGSEDAGAVTLLVGMYAFALQIYGDFSGYSDMARGSARLLGVELPTNFEQPYLSPNITQFWRRWHISLSTWLRDYLYISLGGNRGSRLTTYRNLMVTMVLGGLWHGAAFTFVIWGFLHGLYLSAERALGVGRPATSRVKAVLGALVTFHLVCFAWIFFRAQSVGDAFDYIARIIRLTPGSVELDAVVLTIFGAVAMFIVDVVQRRGQSVPLLDRVPAARGVVYGALIVAIIVFSGGAPVPFIYFQF